MHATFQQIFDYASMGLAGGTGWMVYSAVWRHAPAKFPRKIDDWWLWFRGANQEIAAQHGGEKAPLDPTTPAEPA